MLSFPIAILLQIQINARPKAGIGLWLCLSLAMVIIALVGIAGIKLAGGKVDIVWLVLWQQQESSIAVIMVSMSAFRSLFVESVGALHRGDTSSTLQEIGGRGLCAGPLVPKTKTMA